MADGKTIGQKNRDSQQVGSQDEAIAAAVDSALKNLHTSMPGIIISFDPDTQSASVQPALKRIFTEKGPVNIPPCLDVPVQFPSGGDFALTFPVAPGDECILMFSERAIDYWYVNGGVQLPAEYRLHDYSDGMVIVGIRSNPRKLVDLQMTGAELRTISRSTYIRLEEGSIFIKGDIVHEGNTQQTGNTTSTGTVTAPMVVGTTDVTFGGISGKGHRHLDDDGGGLGGVPQ